ncbi:MAG: metallophosphoesterase [Candidatus Promineofilum sp.]|nr:metallophosphoesterase [Promineifilum sp.]MCW5864431.1 metallophosphoesterase [Anaerolineae bacterium]
MPPVYFIHLSDTHFGPTEAYSRQGHRSLPYARHVIDMINRLPLRPDFVMHTGDVTTHPTPEAYALAAETFAALEVPIYYATGNHDRSADIHRYMKMGPKTDCQEDTNTLSYTFEVRGWRFLVLDARGPDVIDPRGLLSPQQLDVLRREATPDGPPLTIFTHYPATRLNAPWMDANMLIYNGEEMHQALLPARGRLRGVFFGHIHNSTQILRDGIFYCAVASTFAGFSMWPNEEMIKADHDAMPAFNFVQLLPEQTIVQQRPFARLAGEPVRRPAAGNSENLED